MKDKKLQIYLAGPLFNEGEIAQRLKEADLLRKELGDTVEVFNPIEQPFNQNKSSLPTPEEIYEKDLYRVMRANYFVCDLTNEDSGTMAELGIASRVGVKILAVNSDIRMKSANKYDIPSYGMNHFILGLVQTHGELFYSFADLVEYIKKDIERRADAS